MKTWRERIAEARERGRFTDDDRCAFVRPECCLVGEAAGAHFPYETDFERWDALYKAIGTWTNRSPLQVAAHDALYANDIDGLERTLFAIEDRALELKRGGTDRA